MRAINIFKKSKFLQAISVVFSSTLVKILCIFLVTKYISLRFGPEMLGLYGQSQNLINLIITFSTLSSATGITKFIAQYKDNAILSAKLNVAAWVITLFGSLIVSALVVIFSNSISSFIFFSSSYSNLVRLIGLSTFFIAAYKTQIAILNGKQSFKKIAFWEIIFNIGSCALLLVMAIWNKSNILISISTSYLIIFWFMNRLGIKPIKLFLRFKRLNVMVPLIKYSILIFIQVGIGYIVEIMIRKLLVSHLSLNDLGLYEGMNKISGAILLPLSSIISIYFLPLFAHNNGQSFNSKIIDTFKKIIPLLSLSLILIYFLRIIIIRLMLSNSFLIIEKYVFLQLAGIFCSVINLVYLNALLGRGMIKLIFIFAILFSCSLFFLNLVLIPRFGLSGAFISYFICSFIGVILYITAHLTYNKKINYAK
ncbi:oligosaccharide flippase family protein [Pedobacter nanyangensis]|uniref:oligosaccharide flippase family protein n=1 Tax=Pedobacter nanyangensis TaxID=1562389 RepID=UPI0013B3BAB0|nr:oligosaccharide flippase family protein [Pedobacter nanyangensis]